MFGDREGSCERAEHVIARTRHHQRRKRGPLDRFEKPTSGTAPGIPPEVDDPRDAGLTQHGCALGTGLESGQERVPSEASRSAELNNDVDLGVGETAPGEPWSGGATRANPTACSNEDVPEGPRRRAPTGFDPSAAASQASSRHRRSASEIRPCSWRPRGYVLRPVVAANGDTAGRSFS